MKTLLFENHVAQKAKMGPFAGYQMPLWYTSIKEEHLAVRRNVGMFDISHMGVYKISGKDAFDLLQKLSCNDVKKSLDHKMVYSMFLNENGGVLDDVMIGYCEDYFVLVVNASNKPKIVSWMNQHKKGDVQIMELTGDHAFIAVQGPKAVELVGDVTIPRFGVTKKDYLMMRTGYTGEDGVELVVPKKDAPAFWERMLAKGVVPCGLGCRDTLRIEAGLPLYGQELSETITPLMTRYQWVLKFDKEFIGKEALLKQKPSLTTVGIEMEERIIPRTHYKIKEGGEVTSGTLSPVTDKAIGMAFVKPEFSALGTVLTVDVRGRDCKAKVVKVPFV